MAALGRFLRSAEGGGVMFWCPGCGHAHAIQHGPGDGPRWMWNGSLEYPTFTPSVLVRSGHHASGFEPGGSCWCTYNAQHPEETPAFVCTVCHTFVTNGRIQFLGDCTHALAGQTVDMVPWTERSGP